MSEDEKIPLKILVDPDDASKIQKQGHAEVALRRDDKRFDEFVRFDIADGDDGNASDTIEHEMTFEEFQLKCKEFDRDKEVAKAQVETARYELATSFVENLDVLIGINFLGKSLGKKAYHFIKDQYGIIRSKKNDRKHKSESANLVETTNLDSFTEVIDDNDNSEREEISQEEARILAYKIIADYIDMKKNIDRLSKAKINGIDCQSLNFNQVLSCLNKFVEKYPELMDMQTTFSIKELLKANWDTAENEKILEVLRIDDDSRMDYLLSYQEY